jgi:hypothetical protein
MQQAEIEARAYAFRQRAVQAENKAFRAEISEPTRRAWLIVARGWYSMAEREEARLAEHSRG